MRALILLLGVLLLTGCNVAIVISVGSRKASTKRPIISKLAEEPEPCPAEEGNDNDEATVIVNPKEKR